MQIYWCAGICHGVTTTHTCRDFKSNDWMNLFLAGIKSIAECSCKCPAPQVMQITWGQITVLPEICLWHCSTREGRETSPSCLWGLHRNLIWDPSHFLHSVIRIREGWMSQAHTPYCFEHLHTRGVSSPSSLPVLLWLQIAKCLVSSLTVWFLETSSRQQTALPMCCRSEWGGKEKNYFLQWNSILFNLKIAGKQNPQGPAAKGFAGCLLSIPPPRAPRLVRASWAQTQICRLQSWSWAKELCSMLGVSCGEM